MMSSIAYQPMDSSNGAGKPEYIPTMSTAMYDSIDICIEEKIEANSQYQSIHLQMQFIKIFLVHLVYLVNEMNEKNQIDQKNEIDYFAYEMWK